MSTIESTLRTTRGSPPLLSVATHLAAIACLKPTSATSAGSAALSAASAMPSGGTAAKTSASGDALANGSASGLTV